jgi:hypothetical protein
MFRRALCFALTTLALGLAVAPGRADSTASAKVASGAIAAPHAVKYRAQGTVEWIEYRVCPSIKEAEAVARDLDAQGFETLVLEKFALARVPARAKTALLPVSETVTHEQMTQAFRAMKAQNDIAFAFPLDGCYARAHLMVKRLTARGYSPFKVWAFANGSESLQVRTSNYPRGQVEWGYHVAPVLRVRYPGGNQYWFVIDPSMFNRPVRISEWKAALKRPHARYDPYVTMTKLGVAPKGPSGSRLPGSGYWPGRDPSNNLDTHAAKTMKRYKPYEGRIPPRSVLRAMNRAAVDTSVPDRAITLLFEPRRRMKLAA